jgi:hypothetical protein
VSTRPKKNSKISQWISSNFITLFKKYHSASESEPEAVQPKITDVFINQKRPADKDEVVFSEQPDGAYEFGTEHTVISNAKSAGRVCFVILNCFFFK